jgi:DNA-binding protein H-NS
MGRQARLAALTGRQSGADSDLRRSTERSRPYLPVPFFVQALLSQPDPQRLDHEKRKLEQRLEELTRKFGGPDIPKRRPYPKVPQKYCNPEYPAQTWSGRGKRPRWVQALIASGVTLEDLRIDTAKLVQNGLKRAGRLATEPTGWTSFASSIQTAKKPIGASGS